jgi:hypothetical protein
MASAAIRASGASGLVGTEPPPPPVRGSPFTPVPAWLLLLLDEALGAPACVAALVLPEL